MYLAVPWLTAFRGSNYTLSLGGLCYRTEVALRAQTLTRRDWESFVAGSNLDKLKDEGKTKAFIASELLEPFGLEAESTIGRLQTPGRLPSGACQLLVRRWKQVQALLQVVAESLQGKQD